MKKIKYILLVIICLFTLCSCKDETNEKEEVKTYSVSFDGEIVKVNEGEKIGMHLPNSKEGYIFIGWFDGDVYFNLNTEIYQDYNLTAKFEKTYTVKFLVDGEVIHEEYVINTCEVPYLEHPTKEDYTFLGWYYNDSLYDFSSPIKEDITLVGMFEKTTIKVSYDFGYDISYNTKEELKYAYYLDFYNFLVRANAPELEEHYIYDFDDFMVFMTTWEVIEGRSDLYHTGDAFKAYYIKEDIGGVIENQPETSFIGWCYKNNKYTDFINHLITFFAYWRTDEGYSQTDPNGNDFFAHSWSSLVDTAKFFYFTSDTLNIKYPWFNSARVKDALDNIPSVGYVSLVSESKDEIKLPEDVTRRGYKFLGWYDETGERVHKVTSSMKVYAKWKELDKIELLRDEYMTDFNTVNSLSLTYKQIDTQYFNSPAMVTMGENEEMSKKWMWLYKLIASLNSDDTKDPESENFSWNDNRGFYIANLYGLFNQEKHTDTWLKDESIDYSDNEIFDQVLQAIDSNYKIK